MRSKKILVIIVIVIILVLAIAGAALGYLALATDTFKSNKELFGKYILQNSETIENLKKSTAIDAYKTLQQQGTYESDTNLTVSYSEGGEVSNPFNNLKINLKTQKDNTNEYIYKNGQIYLQDEEYLQGEVIRDSEIYGVRLLDAVKQFVSIDNTESIEDVAKDFGINTSDIENYMNLIWENKSLFEEFITKEEINTIKNRYLSIIKNNLDKATYTNMKKAVITVNSQTTQTNAYIANFTKEQTRSFVLEILNAISSDDIIKDKMQKLNIYDKFSEEINKIIEDTTDRAEYYELKVIVYERDGKLVRTLIEFAKNKITIDNINTENQTTVNIQSNILSSDTENSQAITINKVNSSSEESYDITLEIINGDDKKKIEISNDTEKSGNQLSSNAEIKYSENIKSITVRIKDNTDILNEIDNKTKLDNTNNVTLNKLNDETRTSVIKLLKEQVPEKIKTRLNLLKSALKIDSTEQPEEPGNEEMSQQEINKFNAKFEWYTGENVSAENVKNLLEVVKENLNSAQLIELNRDQENVREEDIKIEAKLKIEQGVKNEELVNQIVARIKDKAKYDVIINYKDNDTSKLIDTITITEK